MLSHVEEFRLLDALDRELYDVARRDGQGMYDLAMAATGDEARASRLMAERALQRMRAGLTG